MRGIESDTGRERTSHIDIGDSKGSTILIELNVPLFEVDHHSYFISLVERLSVSRAHGVVVLHGLIGIKCISSWVVR